MDWPCINFLPLLSIANMNFAIAFLRSWETQWPILRNGLPPKNMCRNGSTIQFSGMVSAHYNYNIWLVVWNSFLFTYMWDDENGLGHVCFHISSGSNLSNIFSGVLKPPTSYIIIHDRCWKVGTNYINIIFCHSFVFN